MVSHTTYTSQTFPTSANPTCHLNTMRCESRCLSNLQVHTPFNKSPTQSASKCPTFSLSLSLNTQKKDTPLRCLSTDREISTTSWLVRSRTATQPLRPIGALGASRRGATSGSAPPPSSEVKSFVKSFDTALQLDTC